MLPILLLLLMLLILLIPLILLILLQNSDGQTGGLPVYIYIYTYVYIFLQELCLIYISIQKSLFVATAP